MKALSVYLSDDVVPINRIDSIICRDGKFTALLKDGTGRRVWESDVNQLTRDIVPNNNPNIEVWALYKADFGDGMAIDIQPIVAWSVNGKIAEPITYDEIPDAYVIHDKVCDSWSRAYDWSTRNPEVALEEMYSLVGR